MSVHLERTAKPSFLISTVAFLLIGAVMWDPLAKVSSDALLRVGGVFVTGQIVSASEDVEDGMNGEAIWFHSVGYTFLTSDGRAIRALERGTGRLREDLQDLGSPVDVVVEYLPHFPTVSRIRVDQGLTPWWSLGLRVVLSIVVLGVWLGFYARACRNHYRERIARRDTGGAA